MVAKALLPPPPSHLPTLFASSFGGLHKALGITMSRGSPCADSVPGRKRGLVDPPKLHLNSRYELYFEILPQRVFLGYHGPEVLHSLVFAGTANGMSQPSTLRGLFPASPAQKFSTHWERFPSLKDNELPPLSASSFPAPGITHGKNPRGLRIVIQSPSA